MDIRQLVLVCEKKDEAINNLCNLFDIKVAYHDPGTVSYTHLTLPTSDLV